MDTKLILIGGTSHVGKSTLGRLLAEELGWNYLSSDQLARHPGRPWRVGERPVPEDVAQHYLELNTSALVESVLEHYRQNVWPIVDAIVKSRLNNPFDFGLVLEGSAILPEPFSLARYDRANAVWLTAPEQMIGERIRQSSSYESATVAECQLIDAFVERSLSFNRFLLASAESCGQEVLDAGSNDVMAVLRSLV